MQNLLVFTKYRVAQKSKLLILTVNEINASQIVSQNLSQN